MSLTSLSDPLSAFDWWAKDYSEYDILQNKTEFAIVVLTPPIPYAGPACVAGGGSGTPEDEGGQFIFMGRILTGDVPSPHERLIPDPCIIDTSNEENIAKITQLNSMHTRFTMFSPETPAFTAGDLIYGVINADIPEIDGGYDLQFAHLNRIKDTIQIETSVPEGGCANLVGAFDGMPFMSLGTYATGHGGARAGISPANVKPSHSQVLDELGGLTLSNRLDRSIGRGRINMKTPGVWYGIVVHYDQTWNLEGAILALAKRGLGYHFIIEKNGTINQMEKLDKPIYHDPGNNSTHIGIALNNYGFYDGKMPDPRPKKYSKFKKGIRTDGSERWFEPYTRAQLRAIKKLTKELKKKFPDITSATRHSETSGGRKKSKQDPGPLFSEAYPGTEDMMNALQALVS